MDAPDRIAGGDPDRLVCSDRLGQEIFPRLIHAMQVSVALSERGVVITGSGDVALA